MLIKSSSVEYHLKENVSISLILFLLYLFCFPPEKLMSKDIKWDRAWLMSKLVMKGYTEETLGGLQWDVRAQVTSEGLP